MNYLLLVAGIIVLGAGVVGAADDWPRLGMAAIFTGLGLSVAAIKKGRERSAMTLDSATLAGLEAEKVALLQADYEKARRDLMFIEETRRQLKDRELAQKLGQMQQIAHNLLRYLQKYPQKMPQAQKFINYYQDRAGILVGKYREFEAMELVTPEMQAMKQQIRVSLGDLEAAYVDQFQRVLRDQFIDVKAEMDVLQHSLNMDGVTPGAKAPQLSKTEIGDIRVEGPFPPRASGNTTLSIIPPDQKQDVIITKMIQAALGIFLGGFGAHKFYQGKTFQGVMYFLFCWTMLPEIIGFCEGLRYLVMRLDDFYLDYYVDRYK